MEELGRDRLRTMLGELLDHMESAEEVTSGIAQRYPEYEAMSEAVRSATEMAPMAYELESYDEGEDDDWRRLVLLDAPKLIESSSFWHFDFGSGFETAIDVKYLFLGRHEKLVPEVVVFDIAQK
jgi:hypothetical protein